MTSLKTSLNSRRFSDPIARDRAYRDAAIRYITEDPVRFIKLAELKFMRFWRPWPFAEDYRTSIIYSWFDYKLSAGTVVGGSLFFILRAGKIYQNCTASGFYRLSHACPHGDGRIDPVPLAAGAVSYRVRGRGICTDDTAHGLVKEVSVTRCMCSYAVASSAFVLSTLSRGSDRSVLHPCSRLLARPDQMAR